MSLQSLLFCTDEKIVRVLRRVLSDLEINAEHCTTTDETVRKLTRNRYEAVIVDCADPEAAEQILRSARSAPCNKRAIAVAIIDGTTAVRSAFELGAHFVLYKPISSERAKASFRAARALMKRERRRNSRIAVEIPVTLIFDNGSGQHRSTTIDLSEGGIALTISKRLKVSGSIRAQFTLPGSDVAIECKAEVAWETAAGQTGIRFVDMTQQTRDALKGWLSQRSPEPEREDPPVTCKLTDLSLGGCYLEMPAPFPIRTLVVISMRVGQLQVHVEGVVRVMHPELGMGVEFTQRTQEQREHVEQFIQSLMKNDGSLPDLLVAPEGIEADAAKSSLVKAEIEDPLVELFHSKACFSVEAFQNELRKQRSPAPEPARV
jgi:DNA-binding response OmpR family regulator